MVGMPSEVVTAQRGRLRTRAAAQATTVAMAVAAALLGTATAAAGGVFLLVAGLLALLVAALPHTGRTTGAHLARAARWLTGLDRRRAAVLLAARQRSAVSDRRPVAYLAVRTVTGTVGGALVAVGLLAGLGYAAWSLLLLTQGRIPVATAAVSVGLGAVGVYIAVQIATTLGVWDRHLAERLLGPAAQDALQERVAQLTASRADVVEAVDEERRRIERDLHDGVQQRLVALSMLLGRAQRASDPHRAAGLHAQAHEEAQAVLRDLREVTWRVFPTVLDEAGLRTAVETIAERNSVPVRLHFDVNAPASKAVETAAYFVICEAVTNTTKHAGATCIDVNITRKSSSLLVVVVRDDGHGGADPDGGGLSGLSRRVSALDGTLDVQSPPGGPTILTAEIPCA